VLIVKIFIQQIQPHGIEFNESFPAEWIGLTPKDGIGFIAPIVCKANVTRVDEEVFAKITAASQYESFCYRCLKGLKGNWASDFELIFDIDRQVEFVDMDEDIRQEIILNLPTRILCREDCKGLCVDCGVNLNHQECQHAHSVVS
jgi:uncharacterized protein